MGTVVQTSDEVETRDATSFLTDTETCLHFKPLSRSEGDRERPSRETGCHRSGRTFRFESGTRGGVTNVGLPVASGGGCRVRPLQVHVLVDTLSHTVTTL